MSKKRPTYVNLTIDGKTVKVPDGLTVLEAAQLSGIYIPTLCHLENLAPYGGCRLCMVEIKKMRGYPTACTTPAASGMVIKTKTPEIQKLRREILGLTLSEHPYTCLVCNENQECPEYMYSTRKVNTTTGCNFCTSNGDCELQELVDYLEISEVEHPIDYRGLPVIKDNPFYEIDYNLCILCGRCVRICNEERNSGVLAFVKRGKSTIVGTAFGESQKDAGCEFCGACVDVCPTGSLSEKIGRWVSQPDKSTLTTCLSCGEGCTMNINAKGNRIINIGPEPGNRINPIQLCLRGKFIPGDIVHHPERIKTPRIRKNGKWIEVTWDEAISFTASNLERYRGNQFGMIGSGMLPVEDNYILQKFSRKVMRSNNNDMLHSYLKRDLPGIMHNHYLRKPPPEINQITECDTLVLLGTDASVSHPMVENRIRKASRKGAHVILITPEKNRTSEFATIQLKYKKALFGILLEILVDELKFLKSAKETSTKRIKNLSRLKKTGISEEAFKRTIEILQKPGKVMMITGERILHGPDSKHAMQTLFALENELASRKSADLLFLLDEGNRYGSTFAGMHPDLLPGFKDLYDEKTREKWSENWGVVLSNSRGMSWQEMMSNIRVDGITSIFVTGDIPVHPGMENLKFLVQQNLFETETTRFAHVLFPALTSLEMSGHVLTMDRNLKKLESIVRPEVEILNTTQIISAITRQMQETGFAYDGNGELFEEIYSLTDLTFSEKGVLKKRKEDPETSLPEIDDELIVMKETRKENYRFMGNTIASFVPDLKEI